MNNYKKSRANNYTGDITMDCEQFTDREAKDLAVANWFFQMTDRDPMTQPIYSNLLAYIMDEQSNRIGYIEEHYMDSGSVDYFYTALMNR